MRNVELNYNELKEIRKALSLALENNRDDEEKYQELSELYDKIEGLEEEVEEEIEQHIQEEE